MNFKFLDNTTVTLDEGVEASKFYAILKMSPLAKDIKMALLEHGYDLSVVPGAIIKMASMDEREYKAFCDTLDKIDALGIKDTINVNLSAQAFKPEFIARVEFCLKNGIPFLDSEGRFVKELSNAEDFGFYSAGFARTETPSTPAENDERELDAEDEEVKRSIIRTLTEINSSTSDSMLTFLVSSIITNLDNVILKDNKGYRFMGLRHLVENALEGVSLTSDMQYLVDQDILSAFPLENNTERGIGE